MPLSYDNGHEIFRLVHEGNIERVQAALARAELILLKTKNASNACSRYGTFAPGSITSPKERRKYTSFRLLRTVRRKTIIIWANAYIASNSAVSHLLNCLFGEPNYKPRHSEELDS